MHPRFAFAILFVLAPACVIRESDDAEKCVPGTFECECNEGECGRLLACVEGQCVRADDVGGTGGSPSEGGSGGTSGTPSTGPSCTDLRSGTQQATHAEIALCFAPTTAFSVSIGASGLVTSIDGRACTFQTRGYECFSSFPDQYDCGGCQFNVEAESIDGTTPVGWTVSAYSCTEGCTDYCCSSESGIAFPSDYWLDQTAPGGSGGVGGTSGGAGTSAGGTNPRDPCAGCGYPFCDGNCAGCC